MSRSICFCNNRGGVGKTFTTFQTSCAVAVSNPSKRVLVLDFSIYSELTCALLGGTASASPFEAPAGLRACRENVPSDKRVEGLLRTLAGGDGKLYGGGGSNDKPSRGLFGGLFASNKTNGGETPPVDIASFAVRAADLNPNVPDNLYLIASAGAESFDGASDENAPWAVFDANVGRGLARAIEKLSDEYVTVFFDTDHLAGSAMTRYALSASDLCAVPCPTDTAEFQRLYQTPDAARFPGVESLFGDVMLPMHREGLLRAKVVKMIFSKVPSNQNKPSVTPGGIKLPFTPNAATAAQMDGLANIAWKVVDEYPEYRQLFLDGDKPKREFAENVFSAFKLVPDLAKNVSVQNGVPICKMTPQTYTTVSGITGSSSASTLEALRAEIAALVS